MKRIPYSKLKGLNPIITIQTFGFPTHITFMRPSSYGRESLDKTRAAKDHILFLGNTIYLSVTKYLNFRVTNSDNSLLNISEAQ